MKIAYTALAVLIGLVAVVAVGYWPGSAMFVLGGLFAMAVSGSARS